jgi:sulfur-carrier protein
MRLTVHFYSYFKELVGASEVPVELPAGSTLGDLHRHLGARFPKLDGLEKSTLTAVGVEYQGKSYILRDGDEVSLFPPVQGG